MNRMFFITGLTTCLLILSIGNVNAQFTFSVSPGLQINSAGFGYHYGNFVSYVGLQLINASYKEELSGEEYDSTNTKIPFTNSFTVSETLYVPSIGTKYFFKTSEKLKLYGDALFTVFIPSVNIKDSNDPNANSDLKDRIQKWILYGGQLGFGTEYFFDDNFSIGGTFGIRLLHANYEEKYKTQIYNPNTGYYEDSYHTNKYHVNINPTFVKISFNFYFNGKEE